MGNMVLLCFVCSDHKPVLLSLFMTYPRTFQMNNTTGAFNETGTYYPSRAQEKQELLVLPEHFTSPQISAAPFLVFLCSVFWIIVCFVIILLCPLHPLCFDLQLLITSLLSSDFFLPKIRKVRLIRTMFYTLIEIDTDICSSYYFYICRVCTYVFLFKCDTHSIACPQHSKVCSF